jgi:hypothetical protein
MLSLDGRLSRHLWGWALPWSISCLVMVSAWFSTPAPVVYAASSPVILVGKIQRLKGNQQPGLEQRQPPETLVEQEVVVVKGRVDPVQFGDPFLPFDRLKAVVISRGRSDGSGCFRLPLQVPSSPASEVTVFLVVPGGYYLNRFDGSGSFATLAISEEAPARIVLVDDRSAVQ